ncbi:hypothetical protein [Oryzifoliimicrobium ureilyticus]|uniref:hypothetical protein n=1 Tax=Oryzifoliimicrobium ureilyticus TaxID=3113724 RepID=UPI003076530D
MDDGLENKFRLATSAPLDRRMKRKHLAVYGFLLEWYHRKYGDALASVRHIVAQLKERDPAGIGLYMGDVHSAIKDLEEWGYITVNLGAGRRASRYIPIWDLGRSVHKTPNANEEENSVRENQNTSVRENQNANDDGVHKTPNEDPVTGPGLQTGVRVSGKFDDVATPPPAVAPTGTAAVPPSGDGFNEFWKAWPRKHGLKKARAEWTKIVSDVEVIIRIARAWAAHYQKHGVDMKWVPEPANWLRDERWKEDLPLIHIDSKGAAIAKAKANAPAKMEKAISANDNREDDDESYEMVVDVGPFTPLINSQSGKITGSSVEWTDRFTEKVVLSLECENKESTYPLTFEHTFFPNHPDEKKQARGQEFVAKLSELVSAPLEDTEQLHGLPVRVTVDKRLAISYERAA